MDQLHLEEDRLANTASYRIRQSMKDKWEARAFLAGSPAQWGWEVDDDAEFAALVGSMDDAINGSIYDIGNSGEVSESFHPQLLDIFLRFAPSPRLIGPAVTAH